MKDNYDIIIVGAGPAGSVAALQASRNGHSVLLLDKSDFPRDKSCGDGLTRTSTKLLHKLGLWERFAKFQKIEGVKVMVEDEGFRQFDYPDYLSAPGHGLVVPRLELDAILWEEAVMSGAIFMGKASFDKLLFRESDNKVIGVELTSGKSYYADLVIGADGAASKIAYQAGLTSTPKNKLGFGIRGYYKNVSGLNNRLELSLPILDSSKKRVLPSYGWVFPLDDDKVNIGVGLIEKTDKDNIRTVMDMFVDKLRTSDPRFAMMELEGKHFGAPMRFDFKPDNTFRPGLLLIGDAAGLISPFTGEGIGYAIETGIVAADLYKELRVKKDQDFVHLEKYGNILASKYQGYFETGTTSINRYHLVWKVLKGTFQNDEPLFSTIRQATVFPEGIGESFFDQYTENVTEAITKYRGELRTDLLTISDNIINITRRDWPFLSRLFSASQVTPGIPFRPSLFLLLAGYEADSDREALVKLGTSLELGFAATICHDSVIEEERKKVRDTVNWGNMISILVGDFLLSKSFENIASMKAKYTHLISDALGKSNEGMVLLRNKIEDNQEDCTIKEYLELSYLKHKYAFELCLNLGGMVRSADAATIKTLRGFGKFFGAAYFIAEDTTNYISKKNQKSNVEVANPLYLRNDKMSLIHILLKKNQNGQAKEVLEWECLQRCNDAALGELEKARSLVQYLDNRDLRESMGNLCDYILGKAVINT